MNPLSRARWSRPFPWVLLLLAAALALGPLGCGSSRVKARYRAERDLWKAGQLERRLGLLPAKDQPQPQTPGLPAPADRGPDVRAPEW